MNLVTNELIGVLDTLDRVSRVSELPRHCMYVRLGKIDDIPFGQILLQGIRFTGQVYGIISLLARYSLFIERITPVYLYNRVYNRTWLRFGIVERSYQHIVIGRIANQTITSSAP